MSQQQHLKSSKSKKIELVIQQLNSLPTLPAVAARLLQITVRSDTQAAEVVRLIESDPSLASRIIALATRANMGVSRNATSLSKAVVLLGFDAVRNAVLSIKVFETLRRTDSLEENELFDRVGFWKHSLAVACAAKMLIGHIDSKVDNEEAFVCGLLHDIGKLALDTCLPRSFARVVQMTELSMANIADVERKILGLDHNIIGRRLATKWNLPESITETAWLHHQWMHSLPEAVKNTSIVQTVHLADVLARQQRIGYSGNHDLPDSAADVAQELGCPAAVIDQVARQLPEAVSQRASLLGLNEVEPQELYHESLGIANSELGRLNNKLQQKNQTLLLRSRYFDLLRRLDASLRVGQSVVEVCSLITELWQEHTGCDACAAYAINKNELTIEGTVKIDKAGEPTVFLVDRTDDPVACSSPSAPADLPAGFNIARVDHSHDWFFEQVAPMLDMKSTLRMFLSAGDEPVGEVLWQDDADETCYQHQLKEMQAFAAAAALAVRQAHKQEKLSMLCEQLAQSNSHLQKAQQELLQKRSLVAVGEMACGAAHEINNPLAVVVGRSQFLASNETDPQKKETLETIAQHGREISNIISDLMEFAQPDPPRPAAVTVQSLITEAAKTQVEVAQVENVVIDTHLDDDLPDVFVDREQIGSALAEIIANAIEAYQGQGGPVTFSVRYDDLNDEVIIEVVDHGCGMDEQTLKKAAHPFFSAKKAGRKIGLGLSRSIQHIQNNGGKFHLQSETGKGTCARINLPVAQVTANEELTVP